MPNGRRIRLGPGAHASPGEGVCVVELASLIANEEFSDRPRCVCPVIGSFLRGLNDRAAHAERQRLVPYAPHIVGSRADPQLTRRRRDICLEWAGANLQHGPARRLLSRVAIRMRMAVFCGLGVAIRRNEGAGDYAARVALARGDAAGALELLEALLAVSALRVPARFGDAATRPAQASRNGSSHVDPSEGPPNSDGNGSAATKGASSLPRGSEGLPAVGGAQRLNGEPSSDGKSEDPLVKTAPSRPD